MRVLDLYCGLGGWSKGFAQEGFEPTGVDIVDVGYPYKLILCDMREFDGKPFRGIDVVVGSPPCRDFSTMAHFGGHRWRDPPNPQRGKELIDAFLRIVDEAKPEYWLLENVPGAIPYVSLKPKMVVNIGRRRHRAFWGEFPLFLVQRDPLAKRIRYWDGPFREWKRAEIPLGTSLPLAQAIKKGGR